MTTSRPFATLAALAVAALTACGGASTPPSTEFVVAVGDSSLWVRTGPGVPPAGIEVRRAPLLIARVDGRFHELFVTEDDYSFHDALFAAQTVWRRDLVTGDSVVVYGDATAPRLAAAYGRVRPHEWPLEPDEAGAEEPSVTAVTEAFVVDVLGPFLTVETFADLHPLRGEVTHRALRRVVDLRSGAELSLADLLGDSVSARVVAHGRAAAARGRLPFDERSFAIAPVRRQPGVVFYAPGAGDDGEGQTLPLPAIPVPDGDWWREVRGALPEGDDSARSRGAVARWARGEYAVESHRAREGRQLVLRDRAGRRWPLALVADEVRRVYWLDDGAVTPGQRAALARAFYDASLYDGQLRAASFVPRPLVRQP